MNLPTRNARSLVCNEQFHRTSPFCLSSIRINHESSADRPITDPPYLQSIPAASCQLIPTSTLFVRCHILCHSQACSRNDDFDKTPLYLRTISVSESLLISANVGVYNHNDDDNDNNRLVSWERDISSVLFSFFWFWFDLFCAWFVINLFSNKVNRKSASMQCDCVLQQQPLLNSNKHSLFKYIYCQVQVSTCIRQNSVNRKMKWDKICQRQHLA